MLEIKKSPVRTLLSIAVVSSLLVACGGGGNGSSSNSNSNDSPKSQAIDKITAYADDGSNPAPTLQDYIDAGVTGVTADNLPQLNDVVEALVAADVDTTEELDALRAALGVNIKPTVNAGEDQSTQVNNAIHLTGVASDSDGTITHYQWLKGTLELATTAEFDYTPSTVGTDILTLKVTDNDGATATDDVEITVTAAPLVNQAPSASNGTASLAEDTSKEITLTASDANGDSLTYSKVSDPAHGTLSISGNKATYTPNANFNGTDNFTFKANDGTADSNIATITITVTALNDAPIATPVSTSTAENTPKAITLNASDLEGDSLTFSNVTNPTHGTVTIAGNIATYTPSNNYNGMDSFTYKANDGTADSNTATVSITITVIAASNNAPIANAGGDISVNEGDTIQLNALGSSDPDAGDSLSYSWSPATNLSDASIAQPVFSAPTVSSDTPQIYTLTVTDGGGLTDTDSITVTTKNLPAQPQNLTVVANSASVDGTWDSVVDASAYDVCYSTITIANPKACAAAGESLLSDQNSPVNIAGLINGTQYFVVVVPKNANGKGIPSAEVTATPGIPATAIATGLLNDTGMTTCGDYAYTNATPPILISGHTHSNTEDCANTVDSENDPIPAGQDGHTQTPFDFTKLDAAGIPLVDQTQNYTSSPWSCVKDNTTGLIWEVKTDTTGLHNKDNQFTWYEPDGTKNGGDAGFENGAYDTDSFVSDVNTAGLCGANDWRMPTANELLSILSYEYPSDAININFFPKNGTGLYTTYFTSTTVASFPISAYAVYFDSGILGTIGKTATRKVRLVRGQ